MDIKFMWEHNNMTGTITNMDCLTGIKKIPDKSIHSIITDPPYFMGLTHNGKKGVFSDLNIASVFFRELFQEYDRILTDDGCIYFFCDWRGYAFYYPLMDEYVGARNLLVWDKGSGAGNFYTNEHELIIFHTKNSQFRVKGARNIIKDIKGFNNVNTKKVEGEKVHPTQKPMALIRKLLLDSTKEGDMVLDCFSGSGTTGLVCTEHGRNFIGFEIKGIYFNISRVRIEQQIKEQTQGVEYEEKKDEEIPNI